MAGAEGVSTPDSATRRLRPRPWDHDYLLMRRLAEAMRQTIATDLAGQSGLVVVDYGCGSMPYRGLFGAVAGRYLGADLADNPAADVHMGANGALPLPDQSVDVVLSSQVLEHVLDVGAYLQECRRVLRPGGLLLLSTHGSWIYHPHPTDVRRWTRWGLVHDIERNGFAVGSCISCVGPLAYTTQLRVLFLAGILQKLGPIGRCLGIPLICLGQAIMWVEDAVTPGWLARDNACVYVVGARPTASN